MIIKTRFAPSPTGDLHLGGARTALYSWLFARHHHGIFLLRIEDTDTTRSTTAATQTILEGMTWLGLTWDEGPIHQTERMARYHAVVTMMLDKQLAYKCYCDKERLEALRAEQVSNHQKPRYDGYCRHRTTANCKGPYVIRFCNPQEGLVQFHDQVRGLLSVQNSELDDLILYRSDGTPTYNFCVVVDDWDMEITHIIRGEDHINNTFRQLNLLAALGAPRPIYAHVSMIFGEAGKKLSKRDGAINLLAYREAGFLPETINNYLLRLGWGHGNQEVFSQEEMINLFTLEGLGRSKGLFNPQKLLWLNHYYINHSSPKEVATQLAWQMKLQGINSTEGPPLDKVVILFRERSNTLKEMATQSHYLFKPTVSLNPVAAKKYLTPESKKMLEFTLHALEKLTRWNATTIHEVILKAAECLSVGIGKIGMPLRVAVTGGSQSPAIAQLLELLGKRKTLERLKVALKQSN